MSETPPTPWPSDPAERGRAMAAAGVIGGRQPGSGRRRRDRFSRLLAEQMSEHTEEVVDALRAGLRDDNTRTRVMAARAAVDLAVRHDLVAARDEHHEDAVAALEHLSDDELVERMVRHLGDQLQRQRLGRGDDERVIDAEVVEG